MESNIIRDKDKQEYPYLGIFETISRGKLIVLFTGHETGTCIYRDEGYEYSLGETFSDWGESGFKYFNNTVELRN